MKTSHSYFALVLTDIIVTMFGKKFVAELFQPREVFSRSGFHTLFSKLAHTSIMRLNTTSMDRVNILFLPVLHLHKSFLAF